MLTANAALAKLANYEKRMERQGKQVKGRMAAIRSTVYDAAVVLHDQTHHNYNNFIAAIKAAFPGRKDFVDAHLEKTFRVYAQFDGDYRAALRSVEQGASKKEFIASPFTAAFKNPLPKRKPDGRTTRAQLDILNTEDAERRLADPKQRPVAFMASDDEPRVTAGTEDALYRRVKELEKELAIKDRIIAAQADEIKLLKAKLRGEK